VKTNHANRPSAPQWIAHINSLIKLPIGGIPFDGSPEIRRSYIDTFADEYGNRRATDRPFLGYLLGIELDPPTDLSALDERLWWMIQSGDIDPDRVNRMIEPSGALVEDSESLVIEYRTMVELCALHALWVVAMRSKSESLKARCLDAAAWHTRELQPDNAINRPWATQVFIALSNKTDDLEQSALALLHAQTLIHNSCVSFASPDLLSALILRDVADHLAD